MKSVVKIRYVNFFSGFNDDLCRSHVLMDLCDEFNFIFCDAPDILLVGCYGQEAVTTSDVVKVGYYTENLAPDLTNFDYFFGCEYSDVIDHPRYCCSKDAKPPKRLLEGRLDSVTLSTRIRCPSESDFLSNSLVIARCQHLENP